MSSPYLLLYGGTDVINDIIKDGIKIKIDQYLDNNTIEIEISYVKKGYPNTAVEILNDL